MVDLPGTNPAFMNLQFGSDAPSSLTQPVMEPPAPAPTVGEVAGAYWRTETLEGSLLTHLARTYGGEVDPKFDTWGHIGTLDAADQELALQYPEAFDGPSSAMRVAHTLGRIREELDDENIKARAGTFATGVGIAATFLSTSSLVPFAGAGVKAGRLAKVGIAAANTAAGAVAEEAILQNTQETRSALDGFLSIGTQTVFGGAIGAFAKVNATPAHAARARASVAEDLHEIPLAPDMLAAGADVVDPITRARAEGYKGVDEGSHDMNRTIFDKIPVLRRTAGFLAANTGNERMRKFLQMGAVTWGRKNADDIPEESAEELYHLFEADGHKAIRSYRNAFNAYNRDMGGSGETWGVAGAANRFVGRIKADKRDFDFHVAERLEDKTYVPSDPTLAKHVIAAAEEMRPVLHRLFQESSERGFFKTNKIRQLETDIAKLTDETSRLRGAVAEATELGGASAAEAAAKKLAKKEARLGRLTREAADLDNYFTQSWIRSAILERGMPGPGHQGRSMVEILTREFARTSAVDDIMLDAAKRATGNDTPLDELVEAFEEGGWQALPDDIRDSINRNLEAYARESATKVVERFQATGELHLGEFIDESLEGSSRFKGRRIHLSAAGRRALREEGFLAGSPEVTLMQNIRDVGAKVAVHEKFGTVDVLNPEKSALGRQIADEYARLQAEGKMTGSEVASEMEIATNLMKRLLNKHTQVDPNGFNYFGRNVRRVAQTAFLGGAGLSQLADLFVTTMQMGVGGTMRSVFLKSLRNTHATIKGLNSEQQHVLAIGLDSANGAMRVMDAANMGTPLGYASSRGIGTGRFRKVSGNFDEIMEGLANAVSVLNLQHPMTVTMRAMAFENLNHLLTKAARNPDVLGKKEWARLARYGLSKGDVAKMADMPTYEAAPGFHVFDVDAWDNVKLRNKYLVAVHRNASNSVIQLSKGMTPDFFDSEFAKIMFQFQQFSYGMHEVVLRNFFKGGVLPRDVETATTVMFGLALGIGIDMAKDAIKGREVAPLSERFKNPARTFGTIYSAVDRAGLLSFVSPYTQLGMRVLANATDTDFMGNSGKFKDVSFEGLIAGPSLSIIKHLGAGVTAASQGEWQRAGYHAVRLAPLNTHFALDGGVRRAFGVN